MDLDYQKLNRRLYKKDSKYEDTDIGSSLYYAGTGDGNYGPATEVAEGTVITSAIWQTSGSNDRIELLPDDTLTSYDNGSVGFKLEPGRVTSNNPIIYDGSQQPVVYSGRVSLSNPGSTNIPPGWTLSTIVGATTAVVLTHNLNNDQVFVNVTNYILSPNDTQFFVTTSLLNSIVIIAYSPTYAAGSFTGYDGNVIDSFDFTATRYIV